MPNEPCLLCHQATGNDLTDLLEHARSLKEGIEPVIVHRSCFIKNPNGVVEAINYAVGAAWIVLRDDDPRFFQADED